MSVHRNAINHAGAWPPLFLRPTLLRRKRRDELFLEPALDDDLVHSRQQRVQLAKTSIAGSRRKFWTKFILKR